MLHDFVSSLYAQFQGPPCFRVYGKGRTESSYHIIDLFATELRNLHSGIPLMGGVCITWTASIIAVGWDFAEMVVREQCSEPATRESPQSVLSGRLSDAERRRSHGYSSYYSASEILAHECGHTAQARKMGGLYWLIGGMCTLFREGKQPWNHFENQASEIGLFGGIVPGSICEELKPFLRA